MGGALAERVFAHKLEKVGFTDLEILDRRPFGLRDASRYPLFTPEVIGLMGRLLPESQQERVATSLVVRATKPAA